VRSEGEIADTLAGDAGMGPSLRVKADRRPAVHQMIVTLERLELISRVPGQPRTIEVMLPDDELPRLQPIRTTATRY